MVVMLLLLLVVITMLLVLVMQEPAARAEGRIEAGDASDVEGRRSTGGDDSPDDESAG